MLRNVWTFLTTFQLTLNPLTFLFEKTWRLQHKSFTFYTEGSQPNPVLLLFYLGIWVKARVIYYVNNWIYTTNHKRIAVNYFWFVIVSGICGMILATIIRLEMAYPGVGILAGDSLQYLSVVTAHAVIMVFFMIMPLIFGAFGNFLLPTQLGVHDVAFPRLNSAAFWFLPAGLIMLCQLVCLDRRYQRMNCFNIREVEALLKGRFFPDLVSSHDYRQVLNETALGLRFKTTSLTPLTNSTLLFQTYGLTTASTTHPMSFTPNYAVLETTNYTTFPLTFGGAWETVRSIWLAFPIDVTAFIITVLRSLRVQRIDNQGKLIPLAETQRPGFWSMYDYCHFFVTLVRSELERQFFIYAYLGDLVKGGRVYSTWFWNFRFNFLNRFLYGYMRNNMGTYRVITLHWPEPRNPEIAVTGGFVEFYVTAIDQLLSRTLFLYMEVVWGHFTDFLIRMLNHHIRFFYFMKWYLSSLLELPTLTSLLARYYFWIIPVEGANLTALLNTLLNPNTWTSFTDIRRWQFWPLTYDFRTNPQLGESAPVMGATVKSAQNVVYSDGLWLFQDFNANTLVTFSESAASMRYLRTTNPIFRYDYKLGNYFTKEDMQTKPFLFTTINELTGGIRKASWFFSQKFTDLLAAQANVTESILRSPLKGSISASEVAGLPTHSYLTTLTLLANQANLMNHRWFALHAFDQKFHKMFLTTSLQQRIFNNWRQLRFSREGWRCKLLASRHQKTLYRRYTDEDGIFWAVERNAKDVLPGWAMITPFSARVRFTAIGKVDIGLMGVFLVLNSSIVSSANFLVTYRYLSTLNNRKMRDARSFFTEGVMVASWMMIAANPMLVIGILMLLSDRHWQTSFFDYSGGGDTVLFQHMFWFFGHPEVYVIMIPAFGFNNTVLSFYLRKRVSARASLLYSMYTIAFLGFFVWGHHMYMVGLSHTTRMLFSTLTVMISVPAATKLMHWCVTLVNSAFAMELPLFFMLLFIFFFVSGGISGMAVANTGLDILFHDTFYVVGHFHVMFAGSAMFASFGAFYFYFPSIFGVKFSRIFGYLHCFYYLLGQLMTVVPMIWLGYSGMPRRVLDYPASLGGWHSVVSAGHLLSVAGLMAFFIMIFDSLRQARAVTRNTFGISRFNTRLNFYFYEVARNKYIQRKGLYIARTSTLNAATLNTLRFSNYEYLETTLFTYTFVKRS